MHKEVDIQWEVAAGDSDFQLGVSSNADFQRRFLSEETTYTSQELRDFSSGRESRSSQSKKGISARRADQLWDFHHALGWKYSFQDGGQMVAVLRLLELFFNVLKKKRTKQQRNDQFCVFVRCKCLSGPSNRGKKLVSVK